MNRGPESNFSSLSKDQIKKAKLAEAGLNFMLEQIREFLSVYLNTPGQRLESSIIEELNARTDEIKAFLAQILSNPLSLPTPQEIGALQKRIEDTLLLTHSASNAQTKN